MNIEFDKSFLKDIRKINDKKVRKNVERVILACKSAQQLSEITNIKKLSGYHSYYRIKIGDYRVGFELKTFDTLCLIAFKHRKDIYKNFP